MKRGDKCDGIKYLIIVFVLFLSLSFLSCRDEEIVVESEYVSNYISPEFKIISPKSGDLWFTGNNYEIKWISSSRSKNVSIELYRKNTLKKVISSNTENDGSYIYYVPGDLASSNLYKIKITNLEQTSEFVYSDYFSIR